MKMTKRRDKCENEILEHLSAIRDIYRKYNPAGTYLSICISGHNLYQITANNEYWGADKEKPLDFYVGSDGERTHVGI